MRQQLQTGSITTGLVLCASLLATPVQAQDADDEHRWSLSSVWSLLGSFGATNDDLRPTADDFRLDPHAPVHQQHISPGDPRNKAVNDGQRIYLGENLLSGDNANTADKQSGELYLEFSQRGAELVFRF